MLKSVELAGKMRSWDKNDQILKSNLMKGCIRFL